MVESDPLLVRLARHQLKSGRMPSGIQTFRRWCGNEPDPGRRNERRRKSAAILGQHGQFEEALCHLSAALADKPANPVLHYKLLADQAAAFNGLGWHAEALESARHSLRIEPIHLDAIRERGIAHAGLGQSLEAFRWLSMALENVYRDESALPPLERLVESHGKLLETVYPDLHERMRRLRRRPLPELTVLVERRRMQAPGTPDEISHPNGPLPVEVMVEDLLHTARYHEAEQLADEHIAAAENPTDALARCCNAALAMSRVDRTAAMQRYLARMQVYECEEPRLYGLMQHLIAQCHMSAGDDKAAIRHARAAVKAYPLDEYGWRLLWRLLLRGERHVEQFHAHRRAITVSNCVNPREDCLERWVAWKGTDDVKSLPYLDAIFGEFRQALRTKRELYAEFVGKRYTFAEHHALHEAWGAQGGES